MIYYGPFVCAPAAVELLHEHPKLQGLGSVAECLDQLARWSA